MKAWAWLLLPIAGALALYVVAWPAEPIIYREVIVATHEIERREVPEAPTIRERIVYREVPVVITARAPGGAAPAVAEFCKPVVAIALGDSTPPPPPQELVRSVSTGRPWLPFRRGDLFVSTLTSHGDLVGRDYRVWPGYGLRAGASLVVREPRLGWTHEFVRVGLSWLLVATLIEVGSRAIP